LSTRFVLCCVFLSTLLFFPRHRLSAQEETAEPEADALNVEDPLNIELGEKLSVNVGVGMRTSLRFGEKEAAGDNWSKDINLDNMRLYLSGAALGFIGFELNTDIGNAQGFEDGTTTFEEAGNLRVLDAVGKLDFHDYFKVWFGRLLPPSDRSNLSGPFYLNAWDFPYVQFGYPNIFQGRDDGVSGWGQAGEGKFKWQFGVFEGFEGRGVGEPNDEDNLMYSGRLVLNLLDPEPGYYNQSTYYGEKDILAFGVAGMHQTDAVGTAADPEDFTGYSFDFLFEKNFEDFGVLTLEAAYYDFDDNGASVQDPNGVFTPLARQGESWFVLVGYLLPQEIGYGRVMGRLQPFFRYLDYRRSKKGKAALTALGLGALEEGFDAGLNYILDGHNARFTMQYQQRDRGRSQSKLDTILVGTQLQF
jgi:hypothetical protein